MSISKKFISVILAIIMATTAMVVAPMSTQAAANPKLNKSKITLKVGKTYKLKLKNAKGKVKWSSNKNSVATVNKNGKITAKKVGKATIVAKYKDKKYKCKVTVEKKTTPTNPTKSTKPSELTTEKPVITTKPSESTPVTDATENTTETVIPTTEPVESSTSTPAESNSTETTAPTTVQTEPSEPATETPVITTDPTESVTSAPTESNSTETTVPTEEPTIAPTISTNPPDPDTSDVVTAEMLRKIEKGFLELVNIERMSLGLTPLTTDAPLDASAQLRSAEIITSFGHTRPNNAGDYYTAIDFENNHYIRYAENILSTPHFGTDKYNEAEDKFTGSDKQIEDVYTWMFNLFKSSPSHYATMISDKYTLTGIGISYVIDDASGVPFFYISQLFADK